MFHAMKICVLVGLLIALISSRSALGVAYTWSGTANWNSAANWSPAGGPPGTALGDTGHINTGTATASVQLPNAPDITVGSSGILSINALSTPATAGTITVDGRLQYVGVTTGTTNITFQTGSTFGKAALNALTSTLDNITIAGTVTANNVQATQNALANGIQFLGAVSGTGTLNVDSSGVGNRHGAVTLAPTAANTFSGIVNLSGFSGVFGTLGLSGIGALRQVSQLNINSGGNLKLVNATNPLPQNFTITVNSGGRVDWSGSQTYSMPADRPAVVLNNGASFGRMNEGFATTNSVTETINIANGATVTASRIHSHDDTTAFAMSLVGALIGNGTTTLRVDPVGTGNDVGALRIAPTSANTGFTGNVLLQSSTTRYGTLVLGGTGALSNVNSLTIGNLGQLRLANATDPLPPNFLIDVGTGGRMEWDGVQTYNVTPPSILLRNGSSIGKSDSLNGGATQTEAISIDDNATVRAANILATDNFTTAALTLAGSLSGAANTTLRISPTEGGNNHGPLRIAPASANSFAGSVIVEGGTGAGAGLLGGLVLSGTGALQNIDSLTINSGGLFRLENAIDPLPPGFQIVINGGARMEWEGTQTYNLAPPTVLFQSGSSFGRKLSGASIATEAITIDNGATVTVNQIGGTTLHTANRLELQSSLSGSATSKIIVTHTGGSNQFGTLQLNPSSANPYAGTVEVTGFNAGNQGVLRLTGTGPLANAALLEIKQFGTTIVGALGAADGIGEIRLNTGGTLRFHDSIGSTLGQTTLTGGGLVRSEAVVLNPISNGALRPLSLNNMELSPGQSAGTLTFEVSALTLGSNATYVVELGSLSDLIEVEGTGGGNLFLTPGSTLQLEGLAGLGGGEYVIATYSGTLTGTFGSIVSNLPLPYGFASIDYGTLFNSQITVTIGIVPEPSTGLLFALGSLGCVLRRRRLVSARG